MKTLVTGASGFIGARLVEELLRHGEIVVALCRHSSDTTRLEALGVDVRRGSLDSTSDLRAAMHGCDHIYHLAAFAATWARDEAAARRVNTDALRMLFDAARAESVSRVVYTSTIMTYGPSRGSVITEDTTRSTAADTLYERSKIEGEEIVAQAVRAGLDVVTVHPTRVFGPGKLTEANSGSLMIRGYMRGTWRSMPGNGSAAGNYVFVDDVVRGCIAAMDRGVRGGHYILGGTNATYSEFYDSIGRAAGKKRVLIGIPYGAARMFAAVEVLLGRIGLKHPAITPAWVDVFYDDWICSSARAERELGYRPTSLDEALRATVAWLRGPKEALS
ncbi:MAG: NAD-dependent epimerase/dehydratase family protein [Ignavibacteriae bacterium]|nr:NAD-dependent epimerase/dehydratase family protein [Ignavibacteriota bacterium]